MTITPRRTLTGYGAGMTANGHNQGTEHMGTSKTRQTIATAYAALERAADENGIDACNLLRKATDAAASLDYLNDIVGGA